MKPIFYLALFLSITSGGLRAQSPAGQPKAPIFAPAFQPLIDDHKLAGAVCLIATRDKIIDQETIGYADIEAKTPMAANTGFWIASMTKPFTTTALMMLVEEGKIAINDPVEKYLPELKGLKVKDAQGGPSVPPNHPILVREILSHTSGMANLPDRCTEPLSERVKGFAKADLLTQPGAKFLYVNAGMDTVGRLVEVVSGMPYEKFLQERILTPLGMNDTTFWPNDEQLARVAALYQTNADGTGLEKMASPLPKGRVYAFPPGGLYSTAPDLLKFCRMLLQGGVYNGKRYISEAALETMTRPQTTPATGGSYGLGWMIAPNYFFHDGAFKTRMSISRKEGLVEIFMIQRGGWPKGVKGPQQLFSETAEAAFGKPGTAAGAPH